MNFDTNRRRFMQVAGTGAALSLSGCSGLQKHSDSSGGAESGSSDGSATVTVALQADQQKLRQRESEIRSEVQSGNISQTEAQKRFRAAQEDLRSEAASTFRGQIESNSAVTVEDSVEKLGAFLVTGEPAAVIDLLSLAEVSALLAESNFQMAKAQAQQGTGTPSNETTSQ